MKTLTEILQKIALNQSLQQNSLSTITKKTITWNPEVAVRTFDDESHTHINSCTSLKNESNNFSYYKFEEHPKKKFQKKESSNMFINFSNRY